MLTGAGADKVLTTDASGVASWQTAAGDTSAAGETGYVQFNDGGVFTATSTFYWDNTNARLGIGTTEPEAKLDVNGNISFDRMEWTKVSVDYTGIQNDTWYTIDEVNFMNIGPVFIVVSWRHADHTRGWTNQAGFFTNAQTISVGAPTQTGYSISISPIVTCERVPWCNQADFRFHKLIDSNNLYLEIKLNTVNIDCDSQCYIMYKSI